MRNKKMISFCGILAISAVALATALSVTGTNLTTEIQAADKEYHEVFTSAVTEGQEHCLITSSGTKLPVDGSGTFLPEGQGLMSLNFEDDLTIMTPIGGVYKVEVALEVNGEPYVEKPNDTQPLGFTYAYFIDAVNFDNMIDFGDDGNFRTIWEFDKNKGPSLLSFTARIDNVTIKSLTLDYLCKHTPAESITDPNKYYLLSDSTPEGYKGYCVAGVESSFNEAQQEFTILNKYARGDEIIYFKKPNLEPITINLKQGGPNCAVREGKIRYYDETDPTRLLLSNGYTYNFYFKEVSVEGAVKSIDLYVTIDLLDITWYLVGDEFTVNGQTITNNWVSNDYAASKLIHHKNTIRIITGVTLTTSKGFKVRSEGQSWWLNNVTKGKELVNNVEGDGNIFVKEDGTYDILLHLESTPTIEIQKV